MSTRWAKCILLFLFLPVLSSANAGFEMGVFGGVSSAKMGAYNDFISQANSYNTSLGINSSLKTIGIGAMPELVAGYNLDIAPFYPGIYFKNNSMFVFDTKSSAAWNNGILAQVIRADFSTVYSALGIRCSYTDAAIPWLSGYIGVDAGICHYYANYMEEEAYKIDGGNLYKIRKEWKTAIPGGSLEGGMNFWLNETMGLGLKGGYRIAMGKVAVRIKNISGWTGESQGEDSVDYSGFYGGAGIVFKFAPAGPDRAIEAGKGGQFPELAGKLYNEAYDYYTEGIYRLADEKLTQAEKLSPGNKLVGELKEKLSVELKAEKSAARVEKLINEADALRAGGKYARARVRYSEVKAADPSNETSDFFLKQFDAKADEAAINAENFEKEGNLKKALDAYKEAAEYGDEDKEIKGNISRLKDLLKIKDDKNSIYNEGVDSYRKGNYRKAAELWEEVLKLDPADTEASANLKLARKKAGDTLDTEKKQVEKSVEEAKNEFSIGRMEEATKKCEYALRLDPGNADCIKIMNDIKKAQETEKEEVMNKR